MNAPLRDLMERLAEEQPAVQVHPDTFRQGRRAHRRGTAVRAGLATGVATGLVGVAVLAIGPVLDGADGVPAPAAGDRAPAVPAVLYPVPDRLAQHEEDGYTWHPDVRADALDIGTTAAVFPVNGGAPVAVSAVDGGYRGLELPGFDESSYFRFEGAPVALSPDGTRLAWTWNDDVIDSSESGGIQSGIRIADLGTGEVTDVEIDSTYGVYAHGFGWSPDGRYLAYQLQTVTSPDGEVRGSRNYRVGLLDTTTGRTLVTGLRSGVDASPAVSNEGTVAISGGGYNGIWSPGDRAARTFEGPFESVIWAPSSGRTALATGPGRVAVGDVRGISREVSPPSTSGGRTRVMGWVDDASFVVLDVGASTLSLMTADLETTEVVVRADGVADLYQLSVATDLLGEPTRDISEPDWPTDWGSRTILGGLVLVGMLALTALGLVLRRRRR